MERAHEAQPPCACNLPTCVACAAARQGGHARLLMPATHAGHMDETESQGSQSSQERKTSVHEVPVPAGLFIDANAMKERIRNAVLREEYDVAQFYHKEGIWQAIARHGHFEKLTLFVIAMNALWIWVDTDLNSAEVLINAEPVFQIAEHCFCVYFSFEWTVRFKSFRVKRHGLRDGWFVFDSCLVFMMVAETWVMTSIMLMSGGGGGGGLGNASILRMARLLRLSRMARMARLFRAMPELLILIKGMVAATRSVLFTLCLLAIILYVFGIAFRQLVGETVRNADGELYFGSVFTAMHTLLLDGTLMDGTGSVVKALARESFAYVAMFYLFILLAALTVMNMLIGVLCEVVTAVASTEKEQITVNYVKTQLQKAFHEGGLDKDKDGKISKEEFSRILEFPEAFRALEECGVDVMNLVDNIDFIFVDDSDDDQIKERQLSFSDFMELVLSLRGCNTATVKDIVDLRKFICAANQRLREELRRPRIPTWNSRTPSKATAKQGEVPAQALSDIGQSECRAPKQQSHADGFQAPRDFVPAFVAHSVAEPSWLPEGMLPEDAEMWYRRARLVDSLLSAQADLQKFMETLPMCDLQDAGCVGDPLSALELGKPGLFPVRPPGCVGPGQAAPRRTSMAVTKPFRVRWLPGELSTVHAQLATLQHSISMGLDGLQLVRERFMPAPSLLQRDTLFIKEHLLT
mmetsp:Transcript_95664/g.275649  ORF Transcript_95664/g.275649 Transcript_95664/m.275649 type:complete len:693 (+) Transcript_95664:105-2183(+)